ncbi:Uncharacterized protein HZ326_24178 [Fusarium oxysporum f. sp. albedinis]|nr:Uncharacterized protein HZ326_24178 [Fusarium oxysporum f. sp. albedinis]
MLNILGTTLNNSLLCICREGRTINQTGCPEVRTSSQRLVSTMSPKKQVLYQELSYDFLCNLPLNATVYICSKKPLRGINIVLITLCWDKKKSWSTIYTSGARDHFRLNHPSLWKRWLDIEDRQTSSKPKLMPSQQVINSFLLQKDEASRELVLREAYDRPRHLQALLALCARRRLPLNAIEWPELHDLLLSANPEISGLTQFSRRTFTHALVLNYERYHQILQNNIQEAIRDIHISTDI